MSDAASILVIILSVFLALFLILGIVLVVLLIRVTKKINSITDTVETTTKHFQSAASNMSRFTVPSLLIKTLFTQFKKTKRKGK
jgi:Sec-independent protein translocase protein TatA